MSVADDELQAADALIGLAENTFKEFDTFSPEPTPLADYIAWVKANFGNNVDEAAGDAQGNASEFISTIDKQAALPTNEANNAAKDILDDINDKVDEADSAAQKSMDDIFKDMEGATFTSTFLVLDLLSGIAGDAIDFSDLPAAVASSIQSNIMFSLEFLTANGIADISDKTSSLLEATVESGKALIDGVASIAADIIEGIGREIDIALEVVASIILDPIARLLEAILSAIRGIPQQGVNLLLTTLLSPAPPGFSS